jgi:branched-chain amino acid transport system ATP-binding protein
MIILRTRGLTKRFGQLAAVQGVDLDVAAGERHAIIGANGAGKTSLFHLITGRMSPSAGSVYFLDSDITGRSPHLIARMGLMRSFQITNIFADLSVRENLRLAAQARYGSRDLWFARSVMAETADLATDLLDRLRLGHAANQTAGTISYGDQRRLEIGLALANDPALVLLDEPTAGMSQAASHELVEFLERLPRTVTILLIEHDIDVVLKISDQVTVLHRGKILAQGNPKEIENNPLVQEAYFGDFAEGGRLSTL